MRLVESMTDIGLSPDNMQGAVLLTLAKAAILVADNRPEQNFAE